MCFTLSALSTVKSRLQYLPHFNRQCAQYENVNKYVRFLQSSIDVALGDNFREIRKPFYIIYVQKNRYVDPNIKVIFTTKTFYIAYIYYCK